MKFDEIFKITKVNHKAGTRYRLYIKDPDKLRKLFDRAVEILVFSPPEKKEE